MCHWKIHNKSYNYLVKINKHREYISWFLITHKVKVFESYKKGCKIVKHHVDLNIKNDCKDNLMFISNRDHSKLHTNVYDYLCMINEVENYVDWFLKKGDLCQ